MKKMLFASIAAIALISAAPAMAQPGLAWNFGLGGFALQGAGTGVSLSAAGNFADAHHNGNALSSGSTQSFGRAESGFGIGLGTMPATVDSDGNPVQGGSAADAYGNFAGANVMSGSMSNASSSASDGSSHALTGSFGAGSTSLSGSGLAGGGSITIHN